MEKTTLIQHVLDELYPSPPVPLNNINDFTFLVAVVLSAQTTDGKVNDVTRELFQLAKTPTEMSMLDESLILRIIQPVGLAPQKASYVSKMSKMLVEKFDSKVPSTYAELESLPGVGHKTASVIMSQIFGIPSIAVDTHVHRLSLRWGLSKDQKNVNSVQKDLCKLFPEDCWNKLHLQMIYFGREFCTAKGHENAQCPICSWVHRKDGKPPTDLSQFQPQRPTKNIVYYADRVRELEGTPALAYHSPHKGRGHRGGDDTAAATDLNIDRTQGRFVGSDILMQVKEEEEEIDGTVSGASTTNARNKPRRAPPLKKKETNDLAGASMETKPIRKRKLNK